MKNVFPNITDTLIARYIGQLAQSRKLKRYWGTEILDGVEIFKRRKIYYPNNSMDESTEKFAKYIGAYDDITAKQKGIRDAWFELDISAAPDTTVSISSTLLTSNLNKAIMSNARLNNAVLNKVVVDDIVYTNVIRDEVPRVVKVTIGGKPSNSTAGYELLPNYISDSETDPTALVNAFKSTFTAHWLDGFSITTDDEDPYVSAMVMCALRNDTSAVEVQKVMRTVESVVYPKAIDGIIDKTYLVRSYTADVHITAKDVNNRPALVSMLQAVFSESNLTSKTITREIRKADKEFGYVEASYDASDHWISVVTQATSTDPYSGETRPEQREYYLKADFFETTSLKRKDAIKYFMSVVGSDYRKKKTKWYETLIVIIVIVVAFYFAGVGGAAAAAKVSSAVIATAVAISTTIVLATMYISLVTYAASRTGMTNVTTALGQFLRNIEPLARIAGIVLILTSLFVAIQHQMTQAATAAANEGVRRTAVDAIIEVVKIAVEQVTGVTSFSNMQLSHVIRMTQFTFDIYKDWEVRNLEKELKNYRNELAEMQEAEEQLRTSDIIKDFMSVYPNVLSIDQSIYAERYDRPYEWWSTPFHTGCMQANSVNALWLNKE